MSSGSLPRDYSGVFPPVNVYEGKEAYLLTAEMSNGVLKVILPKVAKAQPRKISVKTP